MRIAITDGQTIFNVINLESEMAIASLPSTYVPIPSELSTLTVDELSNGYIISEGVFTQTTSPRPSKLHKYNLAQNAWEIPIEYRDQFVAEKKSEIDRVRMSLEVAPIEYDGKSIDASAKDVSINIPGKLKEIEARESLNVPMSQSQMFWKDADNVIHTWVTQSDYKNWLLGLSIAIAERTTSLYQKAWQKKAEVEQLTNIESILNYDVGSGW